MNMYSGTRCYIIARYCVNENDRPKKARSMSLMYDYKYVIRSVFGPFLIY